MLTDIVSSAAGEFSYLIAHLEACLHAANLHDVGLFKILYVDYFVVAVTALTEHVIKRHR